MGLALSAASLLAWLKHRPAQSAAALAAASAARLTALSMSVGLIAQWAVDLSRGRAARRSAWLVAIAGTLGTALFFAYLALRFHDPLLHLKAHTAWDRNPPSVQELVRSIWKLFSVSMDLAQRSWVFAISLLLLISWLCHGLLISAYSHLSQPESSRRPGRARRTRARPAQDIPKHSRSAIARWLVATAAIVLTGVCLLVARKAGWSVDTSSALDMLAYSKSLLVTILFLGLGIHAFWKRGPLWGCMVVLPILQVLASGTVLSMSRVVLASFPGFLDAGEIASNKAVFVITVVVCLIAQFALLTSYVNWTFVA